jgi:hypothetical protein
MFLEYFEVIFELHFLYVFQDFKPEKQIQLGRRTRTDGSPSRKKNKCSWAIVTCNTMQLGLVTQMAAQYSPKLAHNTAATRTQWL